jgi:hypothetical protein
MRTYSLSFSADIWSRSHLSQLISRALLYLVVFVVYDRGGAGECDICSLSRERDEARAAHTADAQRAGGAYMPM